MAMLTTVFKLVQNADISTSLIYKPLSTKTLMSKTNIKIDGQVDANIGVDGGEDVFIQAIVLEIAEHNITVRELGGNGEEWILTHDKIKK